MQDEHLRTPPRFTVTHGNEGPRKLRQAENRCFLR